MNRIAFVVLVVLALTIPPGSLYSQTPVTQEAGTVFGRIEDSTGAYIPGVTISFVDYTTGIAWNALSGQSGTFTQKLPSGTYDVVVEWPGFRRSSAHALKVGGGSNIQLAAVLEIAPIDLIAIIQANASHATITCVFSGVSSGGKPAFTGADCPGGTAINVLSLTDLMASPTAASISIPYFPPRSLPSDDRILLSSLPAPLLAATLTANGEHSPNKSGGVFKPPQLVSNVIFPTAAAPGKGAEGIFIVFVTIGKDGRTESVRIAPSPAASSIQSAWVMQAVQGWSYTPAMLDGEPVETAARVTVNVTADR